jgi:Asp-tRNA(Asn)/Glu-tRNA(Gln) amidotransferase A subunit family amidase
VEKLKKAGAIILGKATLAEFAAGDTFGSLFGVTRNPYDPERTVGGSSGGPGASVNANFCAVAVGQEGLASIRRPSAWNSLVGMRPTAGLVSRSGVYGGFPSPVGSLGPMTRTVSDLARLLDVMVGYDPEDPVTAMGVAEIPQSYTKFLDKNGLKGARIGILRESIGLESEPDSTDFKNVTAVFDRAIADLKAAGAELVDPIVIPRVKELIAKRAYAPDGGLAMKTYLARNPNSQFKSQQDVEASPDYAKVFPGRLRINAANASAKGTPDERYYEYLQARDTLMLNVSKVMADHKLDAIVHKSVEHTPTLISVGTKPPYPTMKGTITINTFLVYVASLTVPAGFTSDGLPVGITFFGRGYSEPEMIKLAYAYEQATHRRVPPKTTPPLAR